MRVSAVAAVRTEIHVVKKGGPAALFRGDVFHSVLLANIPARTHTHTHTHTHARTHAGRHHENGREPPVDITAAVASQN